MKKAKDAMEYEDSKELFKTKKINKKEEILMAKTRFIVTNINDMKSGAILWHLIKRHKMTISVTLNIVLVLVYSAGGKELLHLIWR